MRWETGSLPLPKRRYPRVIMAAGSASLPFRPLLPLVDLLRSKLIEIRLAASA
jgi:hypothetical protein